MIEGFVTWQMLANYATLVGIVFMVTEWTKELPWIRDLKTKYYSAGVAFTLILLMNIHGGTFLIWDLVLYALTGISLSLTGNAISDFNNPVDKSSKE